MAIRSSILVSPQLSSFSRDEWATFCRTALLGDAADTLRSNFVNKQPHRLHCFYNKRSTFVHGEEGEDAQVAAGQQVCHAVWLHQRFYQAGSSHTWLTTLLQEIHDRITAIGYDQCKVYIHSIDSQSSANGGIIILVIGEMSNNNGTWRKFTQTFFLAEQPNGYFVLNDIFRYLKEEADDEEEDEVAEEPLVEVPAAAAPVPVPVPAEPQAVPPTDEKELESEAEPTPEPEPVQEPAHPDPDIVPDEAVIAAIPDHDIAPSEPPAVEEPTTATNPPLDESTPVPTKPIASPVPAPAPLAPNGNSSPVATAPARSKPAAPKSWASMAAAAGSSARPAWGAGASTGQSVGAPAPAAAPAAPAAPAPKKEDNPPAASSSTSLIQRHSFYENAMKVQTPHCFVKVSRQTLTSGP